MVKKCAKSSVSVKTAGFHNICGALRTRQERGCLPYERFSISLFINMFPITLKKIVYRKYFTYRKVNIFVK